MCSDHRSDRSDDGAVAVIVAILIVVFLGLAALAVDLGYFYNVRRGIQSAADAGALAGAQELGMSGDAAIADAMARDYAGVKNAVAPADGLQVDRVEVGSDYCQVWVSKTAPYFFGQTIGASADKQIHATARADLAYAVGLKGLVPWFIAVLDPGDVSVGLSGSGLWHSLSGSGGDWSGTWSPGLSASSSVKGSATTVSGHLVALRATNSFGVETVVDPAASIVCLPPGSPITGVHISESILDAGEGYHLSVDVAASVVTSGVPSASVGGGSLGLLGVQGLSGGGKRYTFGGSAPSSHGQVGSYVAGVELPLDKGAKFVVENAAVVVSRQTNYGFVEMRMDPTSFVGSSGGVDVDVKTLSPDDFLVGSSYLLKADPTAAEYGNFFAVDLGGTGGRIYRDNIHYGSQAVIYIGQTLQTETGNMTGPTSQGLTDRFAGDPHTTYSSWLNDTPPKPPCPRLVYVPVCEWMEIPNGKTDVYVKGFAAFFVEDVENSGGGDLRVNGVFLDYIGPGVPGPLPDPLDKSVRMARLVSTGVSY